MKEEVKRYLSEIGRKGGEAGTGQAKARRITSEMARKAVQARWAKRRKEPETRRKRGVSEADEFEESLRRMGL